MATRKPFTLADAKKEFGTDVLVTLPDGRTWACRTPHLKNLIFKQILTMPLLAAVLSETVDAEGGERSFNQLVRDGSAQSANFVDLWVCQAAKDPRLSTRRDEPDTLWIEDVPLDVKMAIFEATFVLPGGQPGGAAGFPGKPDGPDGAGGGGAVRDETERPAVDLQSR